MNPRPSEQLWFPGLWRPMSNVPRHVMHGYPIPWVEDLIRGGGVVLMHYAYGDGDGMMPPFEGWYVAQGSYFNPVNPIAWRYKQCKRS